MDFARTAEGLGAKAFAPKTADELRDALEQAKREPGTTLIHVRTDPDIRVPNYEGWWDVPIAAVSGEPSVQEARAQYVADLGRQRWLG